MANVGPSNLIVKDRTAEIEAIISAHNDTSKAYVTEFLENGCHFGEVITAGQGLIKAADNAIVIMEGQKEGEEYKKARSQIERGKQVADFNIQQFDENIETLKTLQERVQQWLRTITKEHDKNRTSDQVTAFSAACLTTLCVEVEKSSVFDGSKYR